MSFLLRSPFLVSLAAGAMALSLTSAAHAGSSCTRDADCGDGFRCDLVPAPSVDCASPDGQPCDEPTAPDAPAETVGYCREKTIACDSDAQCPAYLSCQTENVGSVTCGVPACAPGEDCPEPTCDEPETPPDAAKVCAPKMIECTADSQCPADFACNIAIGGDCDDIACAPGVDCPQPTCGESKKVCGPRQIACTSSSDCPSDWRCLSFDETSCAGGGSDPDEVEVSPPSSGSGGTPTPTPSGGSSKPLDTSSCTTTTQNFCVPRGYLAGLESRASGLGDVESSGAPGVSNGGSVKDSSEPTYSAPQGTTANAAASSGSSDGGCSTSGRGASGSGLVGAMLVALGACLARRRR